MRVDRGMLFPAIGFLAGAAVAGAGVYGTQNSKLGALREANSRLEEQLTANTQAIQVARKEAEDAQGKLKAALVAAEQAQQRYAAELQGYAKKLAAAQTAAQTAAQAAAAEKAKVQPPAPPAKPTARKRT